MDRADTNYISLAEAAKLTTYSQEYVSLLCRRGKMKGKKFGRNWFIKKENVYDYINETKGKGESIIPIRIETKKRKKENKKTYQNSKDDENFAEDEIDEKYRYYAKSSNCKFYNSKPLKVFESQKQDFVFLKKAILAVLLINIIALDFIVIMLAVPFWTDISKKIKAISQGSKYAISFLNIFDPERKIENYGTEKGNVAGAQISNEEEENLREKEIKKDNFITGDDNYAEEENNLNNMDSNVCGGDINFL